MNKTFVIYDLEFTSWDDAMDTGWMKANYRREIIQIGALKVDSRTLEVTDRLSVLVRPVINPVLSDFICGLTGITQQDIDMNGLSFDEAYRLFCDFCEKDIAFAYGNDVFVLGENVGMTRCPAYGAIRRGGGIGFVSIAPYFHLADPASATINSGRLWQHFGLDKPHDAAEHDALFDCYSILVAMRHLVARGHKIPYSES